MPPKARAALDGFDGTCDGPGISSLNSIMIDTVANRQDWAGCPLGSTVYVLDGVARHCEFSTLYAA